MARDVVVCGLELEALAARYALAWQSSQEVEAAGFVLRRETGALVLAGDEQCYGKPLKVDFVGGKAGHRRRFGGGRGQLVAKACGLTKGVTPTIVDSTAGLGRDAFVLASLGANVLMIERVAAIAALLEDGLARAATDPTTAEIAARLALAYGDASSQLSQLASRHAFTPEVVHLDPMFPTRDKSALVKKEMRLFRVLAGDDNDASRLLEAALDVATHRVVVKRPRKAPPLDGPAPHHVIEGKTSRYDLYVHRSLSS